ncbi:MAG: HEAT repeat domain-containing protein, partial [Candidatus Kaelpia aquatica]|nr:HEAT repeat domain-containing protein [Candidatus Kaelpia aquatica]
MENLNIINRRYAILLITTFVFIAMFSPIASSEEERGCTFGALPPSNYFTGFDSSINNPLVLEGISFGSIDLDNLGFIITNISDIFDAAVLIDTIIDESDYNIRNETINRIENIGDENDLEVAKNVNLLFYGEDFYEREEALNRLIDLGDYHVVEPLMRTLSEGCLVFRIHAAKALGDIGDLRAVDPLIEALSDEDHQVREGAAKALGDIGEPAVDSLIEALSDENSMSSMVICMLSKALSYIGEPAVDPLIEALSDEDHQVREGAAQVLGKILEGRNLIGGREVVEVLENTLVGISDLCIIDLFIENLDSRVERGLIEALSYIGEPAVDPLIEALSDEDHQVREGAAKALGDIGDLRAVDPLIEALSDEDHQVR